MSLKLGTVSGAAGSGTKFAPASVTDPKADWTCPTCGSSCKGYWTRCLALGCNAKRPA